MANFVVTYNIDDASNRRQFVTDFENVLQNLGLNKESTNQSTYYGRYPHRPEDFMRDLFNAINRMAWREGDEITVYYPKPADIGRHQLKSEGNNFLNHIIF